MKIKIISDSTCDLSADLIAKNDIGIVPLIVMKNEEEYIDGVTITPADIFAHVAAGGDLCSTTAMNMDEYIQWFSKYTADYDGVLHINIGSGFSSSYQNACLAADEFDNVRVITSTSHNQTYEQMFRICEDDVFIGISFPRYSNMAVDAMSFARQRGADVIAITDSMISPLVANADQVLIAKSDMASIVDSLVAPLSVINALIVALCMKKQKEVAKTLTTLEEIWDEYQVYSNDEINVESAVPITIRQVGNEKYTHIAEETIPYNKTCVSFAYGAYHPYKYRNTRHSIWSGSDYTRNSDH